MSQVLNRAAIRSAWAPESAATATSPWRIPRLDRAIVGLLLLLLVLVTPAITDPGGTYAPPVMHLAWSWREDWWAWVLQLGLVIPLLWRRRHPLPVFLVVAAFGLVQWLAGPELYGDLALLIALYTVVAYDPRREAMAGAAAVATVGLVLATERWASGGADELSAIVLALTVGASGTLGLVTRTRNRALVASREGTIRQERERIAGEMHDVLAHNLAVMVALADGARFALDRQPEAARQAIEQIGRTGRAGLDEMRRLLGVLHDPAEAAPLSPQPGLDRLSLLAEQVRASGVAVVLDVDDGLAADVPAGVALAAHRIVQEALTNALRHAPGATLIAVQVRRAGADLRVRIENDGGRTTGSRGGGAGLPGMAQRAELLGGTFLAGASPEGWVVEATLPVGNLEGETRR